MNNMTIQDVTNIRRESSPDRVKNLMAVRATSPEGDGGAPKDARQAKAGMSAAENFCPWEFYEGAD